ncbi:LuxR C-terminal-related transcriptional regulator [Streptomyces violascens]|uniref:helix-turn-helix transcriptional regulator n=1 Tax=Streptomyces violascens TaxID=67381 RepID=UPI00365B72B8
MNTDLDPRQARQLAEAQDRDQEGLCQLVVSEEALSPSRTAETLTAYASDGCRPVMGVNAVRDWLMTSAMRCRHEFLLAQPGDGRRADSTLLEMTEPLASLLERGVKVRTIHQHTARHDTATRTGVARAIDGGEEARMSSGPLSPMVVFDRETALIPRADGQSAVAVSQPGIVHFMSEVFERMWVTAMPPDGQIRAAQAGESLSGMRRTIVVLLAEGQTDAMIARRIGVSVRTCRNHIAKLYQELGAQSRFQLGVLITRSGLLGPAGDAGPCSPPVRARRLSRMHP